VIRVLLVDDETLARDRLREMLASFADLEIVGEAGDGEEAIDRIVALRPDVVFLDVQMPGASGLEVARSLGSPGPRIVFCTGFDEYAVEAFELSAADYLLKPVTRARLAQTVERMRRTALPEWDAARERATRPGGGATRFLARCGERFRVVPQDEVLCFSAEQGLTALTTARERHWMEPTLNDLERRLDPEVFFRVSRAAIVRLDAIAEVVPLVGGYGELLLRNGARVQVSRRRLRELLLRIEGRSGGRS
jgi:two-component system LytT family response regulator